MTNEALGIINALIEWETNPNSYDKCQFIMTLYDYALIEDTIKSLYDVEIIGHPITNYIQVRCKTNSKKQER